MFKVEVATPERIGLKILSGERSGQYRFKVEEDTQERKVLKKVFVGHNGQFSFEIRGSANPIRIGKNTMRVDNDIIFKNATVSDQHCTIHLEQGRWVLIDKQSAYGTWLNLTNYYCIEANLPSEPRKLKYKDVINAIYYRFEVMNKNFQ